MNRFFLAAALLPACGFVLAFQVPAALAQAPGSAQNGSNAPVKLLPGLDKELIDPSIDPCVNFVQYTCGNFTKLYPIPADKPGYDSLYMVYDYTQTVLHRLLDQVADKSAQHTPNEQKIGDYYASCMDEKAIYADGLKSLQPELDRISALSDKKQLTDLLAHDQMINLGAFFSYSEQQDFADARKQIAVVDQGGLGLPERDYYFRTGDAAEKTRKDYVAHIATMLGLLGEPADKASADAQKIMALETALANVSMDVTDRRDPHKVYHMMPASQLAQLTPAIDWPQFFVRTGVPGIADLNVANPDFFKGLAGRS